MKKKLQLLPPNYPIELALESYRSAREGAYRELLSRRARIRRKLALQVKRLASRHAAQGYAAGKEEAKAEFSRLCATLPTVYDEAALQARGDIHALALHAAGEIIELHLTEVPATIYRWINEAVELLRGSREIVLLYHPRLADTLTKVAPTLPANVTLVCNNDVRAPDFVMQGDLGAVELAWRRALAGSTPSQPIES